MNDLDIKILNKNDDLKNAAEVMLQLRPDFTPELIQEQIRRQFKSGYHLACAIQNGTVLSVAGFRIGESLAWGKHMYVDDLVTHRDFRSTGAASKLIDWLKEYCVNNGCRQLHLDSGVQRFGAHKFYLNNGFIISSHHFVYKDS